MSAKPLLEFVDTNILVYAYDQSAGDKHLRAKSVVTGLWRSTRGCLSIQVLQEFYVTCMRKQVAAEALRSIVADLALWHVHSPRPNEVTAAIDLSSRYQISFWDAMIIQSAAMMGCTVVWSEDLNSGQTYGDVRVMNPFLAASAVATSSYG